MSFKIVTAVKDPIFKEIYEKCEQILGLVKPGELKLNEMPRSPSELDKIRYHTNHLLNIIGNDYDRYMESLTKTNNLPVIPEYHNDPIVIPTPEVPPGGVSWK